MPKSSIEKRQADLRQALERRRRARRVEHDRGLGDLELEQRGLDVVDGQQPRDVDRQRRVEERARRQVDRDGQLVALLLPGAALAHGRSQYPAGEGDDEAGLLGDRHELLGAEEAVARVVPAHERLDADDAPLMTSALGW